MIREWVKHNSAAIARLYHFGVAAAHVRHEATGVTESPSPEEVRRLADDVLSGVFAGDLAVALERAGAFCRVVAMGEAFESEGHEERLPVRVRETAVRIEQLVHTGEELERSARLWREDRLD